MSAQQYITADWGFASSWSSSAYWLLALIYTNACAHTCNPLPSPSRKPAQKTTSAEFMFLKPKVTADILLTLLYLLASQDSTEHVNRNQKLTLAALMSLHVFAVECLPSRKTMCMSLIMHCLTLSFGSSKRGDRVTMDTIAPVRRRAVGTAGWFCWRRQSKCES